MFFVSVFGVLVMCLVVGCVFFFIPVGEGLSLFPCQRVMRWSVNL